MTLDLGDGKQWREGISMVKCDRCRYCGPLPADYVCPDCGADGSLYTIKSTRWYFQKPKPLVNTSDFGDDDGA